MVQIQADAVIEAYQERLKHVTHELLLAQTYIATQSTEINEYRDVVSEKDARISRLESELIHAQNETDDISTKLTEQLLDAKLHVRQERALQLLKTQSGGLATQIEAILRGHYDELDAKAFWEHIDAWREYEKDLATEATTEYRNGIPVAVTAEGVREEDLALRVVGPKTQEFLENLPRRVPGMERN